MDTEYYYNLRKMVYSSMSRLLKFSSKDLIQRVDSFANDTSPRNKILLCPSIRLSCFN